MIMIVETTKFSFAFFNTPWEVKLFIFKIRYKKRKRKPMLSKISNTKPTKVAYGATHKAHDSPSKSDNGTITPRDLKITNGVTARP